MEEKVRLGVTDVVADEVYEEGMSVFQSRARCSAGGGVGIGTCDRADGSDRRRILSIEALLGDMSIEESVPRCREL